MLNKTVTWNDIQFQRSKMVFNATYFSNIKDQARHFFMWKHATMHHRGCAEAGRATNQESIHHVRSWSSQFTTEDYLEGVEVLDTLQTRKNSRKREMAGIPIRSRIAERLWSASSRTRSIKGACTKNDTGNPTWKNLTEQQVQPGSTSILLQNGLTAEANTRWYNPAKEEVAKRPRKYRSTPWIQTIFVQWKREHVARQSSVSDADQCSSWFWWTWSPWSRSSWWDSPSSLTWRKSPKPTSSDVPALVLNTRKETISQSCFFLTGSVRKYTVARPFAALQFSDAHLTHCAHFSTFTFQGRIEKSLHQVILSDLRCPSATETASTSTTWTSCDYFSLTLFCVLTPCCLAEWPLHRQTQDMSPTLSTLWTVRCIRVEGVFRKWLWRMTMMTQILICPTSRFSFPRVQNFRRTDPMQNGHSLQPIPYQTSANPWQLQRSVTYPQKCACSSWTSWSGSVGHTTSTRSVERSARNGWTCSAPSTRKISCCNSSIWSGCEAKPCRYYGKEYRGTHL